MTETCQDCGYIVLGSSCEVCSARRRRLRNRLKQRTCVVCAVKFTSPRRDAR
jgi:hypothetical protein